MYTYIHTYKHTYYCAYIITLKLNLPTEVFLYIHANTFNNIISTVHYLQIHFDTIFELNFNLIIRVPPLT